MTTHPLATGRALAGFFYQGDLQQSEELLNKSPVEGSNGGARGCSTYQGDLSLPEELLDKCPLEGLMSVHHSEQLGGLIDVSPSQCAAGWFD